MLGCSEASSWTYCSAPGVIECQTSMEILPSTIILYLQMHVNKEKGVEMTPFWVENREDMNFQTLQKYFDLESLIG
jgi:hypothetical protein